MEKEGKNASEVIEDLNKHSGLLGLSEYSHDMRDIIESAEQGNEKAILARDKYVRTIVNYIGQYYLLLGGADAIVFTAGVGENSSPIRRLVCESLLPLGVKIDLEKNEIRGEVTTNEELMIARDTMSLIGE